MKFLAKFYGATADLSRKIGLTEKMKEYCMLHSEQPHVQLNSSD